MTNLEYWSKWALAGAVFLTAQSAVLYLVVTRPIISALERLR
jgi:hypothetical protein